MTFSTRAKIRMMMAAQLGLGVQIIQLIAQADLQYQALNAPRVLPKYDAGNPFGYGTWRPFQHYGAPHYGGVGSNIYPPISPAEFISHFGFGPEFIPRLITALQLPKTPWYRLRDDYVPGRDDRSCIWASFGSAS